MKGKNLFLRNMEVLHRKASNILCNCFKNFRLSPLFYLHQSFLPTYLSTKPSNTLIIQPLTKRLLSNWEGKVLSKSQTLTQTRQSSWSLRFTVFVHGPKGKMLPGEIKSMAVLWHHLILMSQNSPMGVGTKGQNIGICILFLKDSPIILVCAETQKLK